MLPKSITFIAIKGHLVPYGEADVELFVNRYGEGEIIETGQPVLHKKFYAILGRVLKEHAALPWDTVEELADALKRAAGATYACESLAGKPYLATLSVSAIRDFPAFFEHAMRKLADYLDVPFDDLIKDPAVEERQVEALKEMRDRSPPDDPPKKDRGWEYSRAGCVEKMLAWAADKRVTATTENRKRLEDVVATWREFVGPFADKCGTVAWDIKVKNISYASGQKLLEAQVNDEPTPGGL